MDYRCGFLPCSLNIEGETESVRVGLIPREQCPGDRKVLIEREFAPNIELYLRNLETITDNLYYFDYEGKPATLVIPLPWDDDDGE